MYLTFQHCQARSHLQYWIPKTTWTFLKPQFPPFPQQPLPEEDVFPASFTPGMVDRKVQLLAATLPCKQHPPTPISVRLFVPLLSSIFSQQKVPGSPEIQTHKKEQQDRVGMGCNCWRKRSRAGFVMSVSDKTVTWVRHKSRQRPVRSPGHTCTSEPAALVTT